MKCRRIDRAKAQEKAHQGQTADTVRAGCFLKCSESGYILDLVVQSSARGQLEGQRVADKRNDQDRALGKNWLWLAYRLALATSGCRVPQESTVSIPSFFQSRR